MNMGVASKAEISSAEDVQTTQDSVPEKHPYPLVAAQPMQRALQGILCDFNEGMRVLVPPRAEGQRRVRLRDLDTGNGLFEIGNENVFVTSEKRYYIRFCTEVWDSEADTQVLAREYDARGRNILSQLPAGTLSDSLAWSLHCWSPYYPCKSNVPA